MNYFTTKDMLFLWDDVKCDFCGCKIDSENVPENAIGFLVDHKVYSACGKPECLEDAELLKRFSLL